MSMSGSRRRAIQKRDPWKEKPGFVTYYDIGVEVSKLLPARATFKEIGAELGITSQNAYTETVVALGKVCYGLRHLRDKENL